MSNIAFDHAYIILNSISFTTSAKNKQLFWDILSNIAFDHTYIIFKFQ
jgi:hypothetical protein